LSTDVAIALRQSFIRASAKGAAALALRDTLGRRLFKRPGPGREASRPNAASGDKTRLRFSGRASQTCHSSRTSFVIAAENSVLASTSWLNKDKFWLRFFVPNVERPVFKRFPQRILYKDAQAILF
jgi:hypothetical protein